MTKAEAANGIELSRAYWEQVVAPIVLERWPGMPHAAARLGHGSDVLDLDDEMSRDHDWGLRLNLFVPPEMTTEVDAALAASLPDRFAERPTRFTLTSDATVRHRVAVADVRRFTTSTLGVNAWRDLTVDEWLSVTGQGVLEVTAGAVFVDTNGELSGIRHRLRWHRVRRLALRQRDVGLPDVGDPVGRFYDRPVCGIRLEVIEVVTASIVSARVRDRPYGMGSTEQRSHNVDVLLDAAGHAGVRSSASSP